MSILFSEIYEKSIGLFDDPKITLSYKKNKIQFHKLMYTYLQNSISMFNNPTRIGFLLSNYTPPKGTMEVFQGDGVNNTFVLDEQFKLIPNSDLGFYINGFEVNGNLDVGNRTISFNEILPEGQEYSFEQYFPGEFLDDFSTVSKSSESLFSIVGQIKDILARLLVKSWAENQRNFLLDIQNLMTDTDFKISSNSNILNSKNNWVDQLNGEVLQMQNKLAWQIRFAQGNRWG